MNSFYESFERIITGLSRDVVDTLRAQVDELREGFPIIRPEDIAIEMECRYKNASTDKLVGPLLTELESNSGLNRVTSEITDINYNLGRVGGFFVTVRETSSGLSPESSLYAKIRMTVERNTPASRVMETFESMGVKLSFSLEINSRKFCEDLLRKTMAGDKESVKRIKSRTSFVNPSTRFSFDITQVIQTNTMRRDTEVEVDCTTPYLEFMNPPSTDAAGLVKSFISFCEERARVSVYRTRSLIPSSILEEAILRINGGLGVEDPKKWKIERQIPQVRNFQVQDLLKENYRGYGTTPKADGYRYFMVFMKNTILFLRPPNIYKVLYEGRDIPPDWQGFVFDGELVERENWREGNLDNRFFGEVDNYYCIFDVLGFPSEELFPTNQRSGILQRINGLKRFFEEVRRNTKLGNLEWSNAYNAVFFQPPSSARIRTPVMKTIFEIKPYDDATETSWYAADAFFDTLRPKLRYLDDGLILTPIEVPYPQLSSPENMTVKWKPLELLSIDFRYKSDGDLHVVDATMKEGPFRGTSVFPLTREQIVIVNPNNVRLAAEGIFEFIYDIASRSFRVTRPRFDKSIPNMLKDASQIWTDYNRPITENLIRGIGRDGLVETNREVLWSWVEHFLSRSPGPIFDLTDFKPSAELPVRFLENNTFRELMKDIPVYRLNTVFEQDFPLIRMANTDLTALPELDILILNGQQLMMVEGREGIVVGNNKTIEDSYIQLIRLLITKSKQIFVRNLTSILPRELPTTFHPERASFGNEEELVVTRIDDETVDVEFRPGGVFHDVSTGGYDSVVRSRAYLRNFEPGQYVSAGHRIRNARLEDNGPERILTGKHFGKLYDYLYNVVLPRSYFQAHLQGLFTRSDPSETPLQDIIEGTKDVREPQTIPEEQPSPVPVQQPFQGEFVRDAQLARETSKNPEYGDLFDMISKALAILESELSVYYVPDTVSKRATELRLLFNGLREEELVAKIHDRLGLGLVFLRRLGNSNDVGAYWTRIYNSSINPPKYGFLLIEARLESKDLISKCSLLSYQERFIIHPNDPILPTIYKNTLTEIDLLESKLKIAPINSGRATVGSTTWNSLHRLFNSTRYVYPNAPTANREYIQEILKETTDNKADYLINMEVPKRFSRQPWGIVLNSKIDEYRQRGVRPDPLFGDRAENEFTRLLEGFTEKARRELIATGNAFLFDSTYPENLYGKGLMYFRSTLGK